MAARAAIAAVPSRALISGTDVELPGTPAANADEADARTAVAVINAFFIALSLFKNATLVPLYFTKNFVTGIGFG